MKKHIQELKVIIEKIVNEELNEIYEPAVFHSENDPLARNVLPRKHASKEKPTKTGLRSEGEENMNRRSANGGLHSDALSNAIRKMVQEEIDKLRKEKTPAKKK